MNSRAVKRIEDVARLRQAQFPEDAGTMSHPIRPDSYVRMGKYMVQPWLSGIKCSMDIFPSPKQASSLFQCTTVLVNNMYHLGL